MIVFVFLLFYPHTWPVVINAAGWPAYPTISINSHSLQLSFYFQALKQWVIKCNYQTGWRTESIWSPTTTAIVIKVSIVLRKLLCPPPPLQFELSESQLVAPSDVYNRSVHLHPRAIHLSVPPLHITTNNYTVWTQRRSSQQSANIDTYSAAAAEP